MYLNDDALKNARTPINRKLVGPAAGGGQQIYIDFKPQPFHTLAPSDMLDTADLCKMFGCSVRTVYRWITDHSLKPALKVGREFLFTKREVVRWYNANRPRPGRPPS